MGALLIALLAVAAVEDAPEQIISSDGLTIRIDERVFTLFAAMNALGYASETRHGGPPIEAPLFHPVRSRVREFVRRKTANSGLEELRALIVEHPHGLEHYLKRTLATSEAEATGEAARLGALAGALDRFRGGAALDKVFDEAVEENRSMAKELATSNREDLERVTRLVGEPVLSPRDLVVVLNPLDAQDAVQSVVVGPTTYLVVGPNVDTAKDAILIASLGATISRWVDEAYRAATRYQKSWEAVSKSENLARRFPDGRSYLSDALARALAHRARHDISNPTSDAAFTEAAARDGLHWVKPALAVVSESSPGPLRVRLAKGLAKHGPTTP